MNNKELKNIKKEILKACYVAREGHVASSYSILDILYVLYGDVLNISPDKVNDVNRDRFILSKGHAAIGYYAILRHYGYFSDAVDSMCKYGSILGGHPDANKINGVEVSTGSLGHGLPVAVGMALGLKILKNDAHIYCLIGDGEINEGSMWESLLICNHHKLNNITLILDYNHSTDRAIDIKDIGSKFECFGFETVSVDGHNHDEIRKTLLIRGDKPVAVIANTVKGNGIIEMTNNPAWHHRIPTEEELNRFLEELS